MDTNTGVIPGFNAVQVTETGSSVGIALEGFQCTLSSVVTTDFNVNVIVTDRHVQIRKATHTNNQNMKQQFDV